MPRMRAGQKAEVAHSWTRLICALHKALASDYVQDATT